MSQLPLITHIDLSVNYLNGIMLPDDLPSGAFRLLQVLVVDNNNIAGLVVPSVLSGMAAATDNNAGPGPDEASASVTNPTSGSSAFNAIGNNNPETNTTNTNTTGRYYRPPGNWKELRIFSAANNAITVIPPEASHWNKLATLNLRNNKIKVLPGSLLRQWSGCLTKLSVGSNNISVCPEDIGNCTLLKELDFS